METKIKIKIKLSRILILFTGVFIGLCGGRLIGSLMTNPLNFTDIVIYMIIAIFIFIFAVMTIGSINKDKDNEDYY